MSVPWLVLPTYEEAQNLEQIVELARGALSACSPAGFRILIVDDDSPDGTGAIADRLATGNPAEVEVLHRRGMRGLGPAYIAGFQRALQAGATHVLEMDADGSHDPGDLARLFARTQDGADLALGSRYADGGRIEDWGPLRRVLSWGGSTYARLVLGVPVRDLTGGFKCFRADVLHRIDLETVRSQGYAFQVELTYRALRAGCSVVEVPITFRDREHGRSKMSAMIAFEAVWRVPTLRSWRPS